MSLVQNYYNDGTVSVAHNSPNVVGTGTSWATLIRAGDIFEAQGLTTRILTVLDNGRITLADNWPGTDIVAGTYEIRIPSPSADLTASIRTLLEGLDGGAVEQLSALTYANGDFIHFDTSLGAAGELTNITPTVTGALLSAVMKWPAGLINAPSITFTSDNNTGIWNAATDTMGLVCNGIQKVTISPTGLGIRSTGAAFDVNLASTEVLTANRTLTVTMGDAARSLSLGGNITTAGALVTSGANSLTLTTVGATNVTLPTAGTLATQAGTETLTNKTFNASNNTLSNITTAMLVATTTFDTDGTLTANSTTRIPSQSAVKSYVDNSLTGLSWKAAVVAGTTISITLSAPQTIDGVSVVAGNRVLVKNQATASTNGIYVCAAGAWTRATDNDSAAEFPNATVFIEQGTSNGDTQWTCTNDPSMVLGTTAVTFAQVSGSGSYSASTGLTLTGNAFSVTTNGITYSLLQQVAASSLVGNATGSLANATGITIGASLAFSGSALQTVAMTGDVTTSANSFATTVAKIGGTSVGTPTGTAGSAVVLATAPSVVGGSFTALTTLAIHNAGTGAFDMTLAHNGTLTAGRTLTINMGDAVRTLTFGGNITTSGGNIQLTATGSTNVTLPLSGTLATLAGTETLTNKSINCASGTNTITNIDSTMFASGVFDTDATLSAASATRIPSQSAVKGYVDSMAQGLAWKTPCVAVATTNNSLSGPGTIDGVSVVAGNRVLVIGQTTGSANGIYICNAGAWTRATDADLAAELVYATVLIEGGTTNHGAVYTCTNTAITLGTTSLTFVQAGVSTGTVTAGTGITVVGTTVSVTTNGVTYALLQQVAASSLVGNATGSTANATGITLGASLAFSGSALQTAAMTGDVTATANSFATTVAKIQTKTVSGTTGTTNVVFSDSPTLTTKMTLGSAILAGPSTAVLQFGGADAAAPVSQTLSAQNVVGGTTNTAGVAFIVAASQGTGTGVGGDIVFKVAPAGSTGSTQNALATALTINGNTKAITTTAGVAVGAGLNVGSGLTLSGLFAPNYSGGGTGTNGTNYTITTTTATCGIIIGTLQSVIGSEGFMIHYDNNSGFVGALLVSHPTSSGTAVITSVAGDAGGTNHVIISTSGSGGGTTGINYSIITFNR